MSILWTGTSFGKTPEDTADPAARAADGSAGPGTPPDELTPPAALTAFGGGVGGGRGIPGLDLAFLAGLRTCLGLIQSRRAKREKVTQLNERKRTDELRKST